jgi:hypothetical protein
MFHFQHTRRGTPSHNWPFGGSTRRVSRNVRGILEALPLLSKSTLGKLRVPFLPGLYELKCTFRFALTSRAKFSVHKSVVLLK